LSYSELREFAWLDGFKRPEDMMDFFEPQYGFPVALEVIYWEIETLDVEQYAAINLTYHIGDDIGMEFVRKIVPPLTLWKTATGKVVGMMPWDWHTWMSTVMVLPWYLFTGIPVGWERLKNDKDGE
jgi:hypothetical protein